MTSGKQKGFALVELLLVCVAVAIIGFIGLKLANAQKARNTTSKAPGTSTPPPSEGSGPAQSGPIQASNVTSGGATLKRPEGYTSTNTASISPVGGGMLLVWVGDAVGSEEVAPVPSVTGLNLDFRILKTSQKKENAPRRFTLFAANLPANPGSGALTINFNQNLPSSNWFWTVDRVSSSNVVRIIDRVDGGFLTSYSITFDPATQNGNVAIAGLLAGEHDMVVSPGAGLTKLGQGQSSFATVMSEWTSSSRGILDFSWTRQSHCLAIALEIAP